MGATNMRHGFMLTFMKVAADASGAQVSERATIGTQSWARKGTTADLQASFAGAIKDAIEFLADPNRVARLKSDAPGDWYLVDIDADDLPRHLKLNRKPFEITVHDCNSPEGKGLRRVINAQDPKQAEFIARLKMEINFSGEFIRKKSGASKSESLKAVGIKGLNVDALIAASNYHFVDTAPPAVLDGDAMTTLRAMKNRLAKSSSAEDRNLVKAAELILKRKGAVPIDGKRTVKHLRRAA